MSEANDKTIALNVRLKPVDHSDPRWLRLIGQNSAFLN